MRVAYYAHHHGSGHIRHARNLAANSSLDVLILTGSELVGDLGLRGDSVVKLTSDLVDGYQQPANSPYLFTPSGTGAANVRARFREIHDALFAFDPDVVICDVSAEVAGFAKLAGYRTIVRRMPGDRTDLAHRVMYETADAIVAYYPAELEQDDYPAELKTKTFHTGMIRPHRETASMVSKLASPTVIVLTSLGGTGVDVSDINAAARQTPELEWKVLGLVAGPERPASNVEVLGVVDDPAPYLTSAEVVVASGGHNAVCAAAACDRPVVIVPEKRPFNEQLRFAESLGARVGVPIATTWRTDWRGLITEARSHDPSCLGKALFVSRSEYEDSYLEAIDFASKGAIDQRGVDLGR